MYLLAEIIDTKGSFMHYFLRIVSFSVGIAHCLKGVNNTYYVQGFITYWDQQYLQKL